MATCDFLLIGCEGCGKTTMLKQFSNITKNIPPDYNQLNTLPTNGVELETITYKKHKYVVREIGGNFLPVWSKYYESALMVIYMVDMANYAQLPVTCVEFLNLLTNKALHHKNFLVLLNKVDQPYAMTRNNLEHILFLEAAKKEAYEKYGQVIWVEEISAAKGIGLDKVLFWMHDTKKNLSHITPSPSPSPRPTPSPKGPSHSPKGLHLQPTPFFPSYANSTIYELGLASGSASQSPFLPNYPKTTLAANNISTTNNSTNNTDPKSPSTSVST